jgi:hypothetical protein
VAAVLTAAAVSHPPLLLLLLQYAHWEESQKDFRRARSVWERALDIDYTNVNFWLKVGGWLLLLLLLLMWRFV